MSRLACLLVPLFPLAARLRAEPELFGIAVAVCEGNGSAARIVAPSRAARQHGIRIGTTLAHARGILPDLVARSRDPDAERAAHEALMEAAATLSPRVEDAGLDLAYADVAGMERLFPGDNGEHELGRTAIMAAERLQLPIRVGIATTKLAAHLAAARPQTPTVVARGDEQRFLAPLPVSRLGLERRIVTTLHRWGVRTIGDLAELPADRVASRLGPSGAAAHRAACGEDCRPLVPTTPPAALAEGMELEWAVMTLEPLMAALRGGLERLVQRLAQHDLACTRLELELELEPEGLDRRTVRVPAPTRDAEALLGLLHHDLEGAPPQAPVVAFRCLAWPDRPRRGQLTLFGAPEIAPDALAITLARLVALLGGDRVGSPQILDDHRPEISGLSPFAPPPPPPERRPPEARGRGLLAVRILTPPVPLEVIADDHGSQRTGTGPAPADRVCDGARPTTNGLRLVSVASQPEATPRIQGLVRVASGPWQLEDGWWREQPVARDYWDVELSGGGLYRIYRERESQSWFADGMYD